MNLELKKAWEMVEHLSQEANVGVREGGWVLATSSWKRELDSS